METALTPELPIDNMDDFKEWLRWEYAELTKSYNRCFPYPTMHTYHNKRLELIKVGRAVGIELAPPSLERKLKEEKDNG